MKNTDVQAVIFDMDGVLIDSEIVYLNRLVQFVQDYLGKKIPKERLISMVGATGAGHFHAVREYCPPEWDLERFRKHYRQYGKENPIDYSSILFPDTIPTLEWLRKHGYRIMLATSTDRKKAEEIKAVCGFGAYMEFTLCGDMFQESKPNPEIYLKCLELLKLSRRQCLVIEDSPYGIEAAVRAGIPVAVRRETRFVLDQRGGDWYFDRLSELPGFLES